MGGTSIQAQMIHDYASGMHSPRILPGAAVILSNPVFNPLWKYLRHKLMGEPPPWDPFGNVSVCSEEIERLKRDRALRRQVAIGIGYDPNTRWTDEQWRFFNPIYERAQKHGYTGEKIRMF